MKFFKSPCDRITITTRAVPSLSLWAGVQGMPLKKFGIFRPSDMHLLCFSHAHQAMLLRQLCTGFSKKMATFSSLTGLMDD